MGREVIIFLSLDGGAYHFFLDRRNDKVIINSHTQMKVLGFELWSRRPSIFDCAVLIPISKKFTNS